MHWMACDEIKYVQGYTEERRHCLFIRLSLSLSLRFLKKLWSDFDEFLGGWDVAQGPID